MGGGVSRSHCDREFDIKEPTALSAFCTDCGIGNIQNLPSLNFSDVEISGHVLAGYLYRTEVLGFGIEADYTFGEDELWGSVACSPEPSCAVNDLVHSIDHQAHVRAIAGASLGPFFWFLAAGVAIAEVETRLVSHAVQISGPIRDVDSESETVLGLSLGTGVQVEPTRHLAVRGELLFDEFEETSDFSGSTSAVGPDAGATALITANGVEIDNVIARLSVIWNF